MSKQITRQSSKQGKPGSNKQTASGTNKQGKVEQNKAAKFEPNKEFESNKQKTELSKTTRLDSNKQGQGKVETTRQTTRPTPKQARQDRRREELRRREEEQRRAARTRRIALFSAIAVLLVAAGISVFFYIRAANQPKQPVNPAYPSTGKISCDQGEQTAYHIHAHLTMYINGQVTPLSQGIGIAPDNSCLYWLHTHSADGVIHIEAPAHDSFTLGDFLNLWGNQFVSLNYPPQLDTSYGWHAWVNGKPYSGDFHNIPLQAHTLITLAYNSPGVKPDTTYNWGSL